MQRRSFLKLAAFVAPLSRLGLSFPSRLLNQSGDTKFVAPPQAETAEVAAAVDKVAQLLKSGRADTSAILSNPDYISLHQWPRFRLAIRDHASRNVLLMTAPNEAGTRLRFRGTVLDSSGAGVPARIYVYQTSAKGWYSDKAAHVSGNSGDRRYARLFGYVLSSDNGQFEVKTIRPAGYPDSSLPAHIHVEIETLAKPGEMMMITEAQFADDPRLTADARRRSQQERFVICDVVRKPDGSEEIAAVFRA